MSDAEPTEGRDSPSTPPDDGSSTVAEVMPSPGETVGLRRLREGSARMVRMDGSHLVVGIPAAEAVDVRSGDDVEVRVGDDAGAAWFVDAVVDEVDITAAGRANLRLRPRGTPRRAQQRRHVRIPAFDLQLRLRAERTDGDDGWFSGTGLDISAGGIRFSTGRALRRGDVVDVRAELPSERQRVDLDAEAIIVWASPPTETRRVPFYALRFTDLRPAEEDRIVSWVLERQTHRAGH